jgi:hypothetical protein
MDERAFLAFLQHSIAQVHVQLPQRGVGKDFIRGRCEVRWARMSEKERLGFLAEEYEGLESDPQNNGSEDIGQLSGEMQDVGDGEKVLPRYKQLTAEELYGHSMVWDMQADAPEDAKQTYKIKKKVVTIKEEKLMNERRPDVEGSKKRKNKKDPNLPKRAPSSYLLFCAAERPKVLANLGGGVDFVSVNKELGRR